MNIFGRNNNIQARGSVIINGRVIEGNNVCINGDKIIVDGRPFEEGNIFESKEINITINGTIKNLKIDGNVNVLSGNVEKIDASGSVTVSGDVNGNIDCNGSVSCGNVTGNVDANGNVMAKNIAGDVDAMSVMCK